MCQRTYDRLRNLLVQWLTLGRLRKLSPPPWYKRRGGGGGGRGGSTPPRGFCVVIIFTSNTSIDSLSCDLQDKVNIMGYCDARALDAIQNGRQDDRHLGFC